MADTLERFGRRTVLAVIFATEDHDPARVSDARAAVHAWLADHEVVADVCDRVLLVVSELVTDALRCTSGRVHVALTTLGSGLLIEVFDERPPQPRVVDAPDVASSGRGIAIVEAGTDRWGVRHEFADAGEEKVLGKVVWAVISPC